LGGGTIGGDPAAGVLLLHQMREQVVLDALGARLEGRIGGEIQKALGRFGGEPIGDRGAGRGSSAWMASTRPAADDHDAVSPNRLP
jgi:hypothetical protein